MSLSLTGRDLITRSFKTLGVIGAAETPSAEDMASGFALLNELVDSWNVQSLTVTLVGRTVYNLVANKGGPDNPYTLGPGGDFDTGTMARPDYIQTANLLLNTTSNYPTEIPLAILTDDMYAANPIKSLRNAQPQSLYYQRSVPLGQIVLWNVPNTNANQLVLYFEQLTPQFADLSTLYVCPPAYAKAFRLCLADALIGWFAVPPDTANRVMVQASEALAWVKASNANAAMADLSLDPAYTPNNHGTYIIQTDTGA